MNVFSSDVDSTSIQWWNPNRRKSSWLSNRRGWEMSGWKMQWIPTLNMKSWKHEMIKNTKIDGSLPKTNSLKKGPLEKGDNIDTYYLQTIVLLSFCSSMFPIGLMCGVFNYTFGWFLWFLWYCKVNVLYRSSHGSPGFVVAGYIGFCVFWKNS